LHRVNRCPHCGNRTPHELIHTQRFETEAWHFSEEGEEGRRLGFIGTQFVAVCQTCQQILVYVAHQFVDKDFTPAFADAELIFPEPDELHYAVPESVADIYEEAARIQHLAPHAYAVSIRRALEAVCEDRGVHGGSLHHRLRELAARGDIPPTLAEMTDVLRKLGNIGAHYSTIALTHPDLWAIKDFFLAVVEYVYVAPRKLSEFQKRLKSLDPPSSSGPSS
jgi:hypothetical protein